MPRKSSERNRTAARKLVQKQQSLAAAKAKRIEDMRAWREYSRSNERRLAATMMSVAHAADFE
jgi:hypothetical protein